MILSSQEAIHDLTKNGYWGNTTVIDLLYEKAAASAEQEALVDPYNKGDLVGTDPKRLTYKELVRGIDQLAVQFLDWGVKRDDVIIVQLPNIMELTLAIFAAARVGAVVSPIPVQWRAHEIRHAVSLTDAVLCVTSHSLMGFDHVELFQSSLPQNTSLRRYVTVGKGSAEGAVNIDDILAPSAGENDAARRLDGLQSGANDIFTICWTSGTEAAAKAVPRSHNHWLAISSAVVESFLKPDEECTYLSLFPTINMAGLGAVLIPWVMTGGKMILHHPFDLGIFLKQIVGEKVSYTLAPPALLDNLAKSAQWAEMDKGALKVIGSGSAPLSTWMVKTF
ncbi:MAG: acyl--CoA ligase, partial [Desulfobacteraceae bacterium]|nr:acyl--CoA ligase [Desulfobacteraceae bacterium]